jgi:hypothetical protein
MELMVSADTFAFDRRAVYRIRVQGHIEASWSDRLAGMTITAETSDDGLTTTTLVGELRDQACLAGVINALYESHRPVILVERQAAGENSAVETNP